MWLVFLVKMAQKKSHSVQWMYDLGELNFLKLNEQDVSFDASFENSVTGAEFTRTFDKKAVHKLNPMFLFYPRIFFDILRSSKFKPNLQLEDHQATCVIEALVNEVPVTISFLIPKKQYEGNSETEELRQQMRVGLRRHKAHENNGKDRDLKLIVLEASVKKVAESQLVYGLFSVNGAQWDVNKPHIEDLLHMGADVNAAPMGKGHPTSLVWGFFTSYNYTNYLEATDFLLEHGADVNMKNPTLNSKHEPLLAHIVASQGHHGATPELVKFCRRLIEEYDVDLEAVDDEKKDVIWTCAETLETHPGKKNSNYGKQMEYLKEVQQMMLRTRYPRGGDRRNKKKK